MFVWVWNMLVSYHNARDLNIHERLYECMCACLGTSWFTPLCVHVTHTQHTHIRTHIHAHTYTRTHTHGHTYTHHTIIFLFTRHLFNKISFQRWTETSKLLGRISPSELNSQSCVVLLCLVLFCSSVYVRMYVSVCSFSLFSFALLAGGRFSSVTRSWVSPPPFFRPDSLESWCLGHDSETALSVSA